MKQNKDKNDSKSAVIYCRVSTREQVEEGNSLASQEKICREYAHKNGHDIVETFIEEGESAKTTDRTKLQQLFLFCAEKKNKVSTVIVYKLDRLSRNTDDYSQIRILLKRYGVEIKSTTEYFENTPAGRFMENMLANVAQFDNDVRTERSMGGMRDAVREGRFVWGAPIGYKNVSIAGKATIALDDDMAPLVKETFVLLSKGIYDTETVRKMMTKAGLLNKAGKPLSKSYFPSLVRNELYAGWINMFGERHKGLFQPIVDEELFNCVQKALKKRGKRSSTYKTDNADFPLRRFVAHPSGLKLTGSWSQGRSAKYPFYRFGMKGSNYRRDDFESDFCSFIDGFGIKEEHLKKLESFVKEKFYKATEDQKKEAHLLRVRLKELNEQQTMLIQKNLRGFIGDNTLKQQLDIIEDEITDIEISLAGIKENEIPIEDALAFCEAFLRKPSFIWQKCGIATKLKLQWFQFPQGITFDGEKFGTAEIACVFKAKDQFMTGLSDRVHCPVGFWNRFMAECEYLSNILKEEKLIGV